MGDDGVKGMNDLRSGGIVFNKTEKSSHFL